MPRQARKYSRRIEVYKNTPTDNGFGGLEAVETLVKKIWADVSTPSRDKLTDYGLNVSKSAIQVYIRAYSDDIDWGDETLFLKFEGKDFVIQQITDIDYMGIEYEIIAIA